MKYKPVGGSGMRRRIATMIFAGVALLGCEVDAPANLEAVAGEVEIEREAARNQMEGQRKAQGICHDCDNMVGIENITQQ